MNQGARVNLLIGAGQIPARIQFLATEELGPGESAMAQLRLSQPVFAFAQDHFILRDPSEQTTLAGGVVLDPTALRTGVRDPGRLHRLADCASPAARASDFLLLELKRNPIGRIESYLRRAKVSATAALKAVGEQIASGRAVQRGGLLASADSWSRWKEETQRAIDQHHARHPEQLGLPLAHLRAWLTQEVGMTLGHDELFNDLARQGFVVDGLRVRRVTHQPALPPHLSAAGQHLRETLIALALDPPPRATLIAGASGAALRFLVEAGEIIDLGSDVVLHVDAFVEARRRTRDFLRRQRAATTSEIRQHLGTTRRVVIPLLERFDQEGLTTREGDQRRLRPSPPTPSPASASQPPEKPFARGGIPQENP